MKCGNDPKIIARQMLESRNYIFEKEHKFWNMSSN
jgi:hypothetical protein